MEALKVITIESVFIMLDESAGTATAPGTAGSGTPQEVRDNIRVTAKRLQHRILSNFMTTSKISTQQPLR